MNKDFGLKFKLYLSRVILVGRHYKRKVKLSSSSSMVEQTRFSLFWRNYVKVVWINILKYPKTMDFIETLQKHYTLTIIYLEKYLKLYIFLSCLVAWKINSFSLPKFLSALIQGHFKWWNYKMHPCKTIADSCMLSLKFGLVTWHLTFSPLFCSVPAQKWRHKLTASIR